MGTPIDPVDPGTPTFPHKCCAEYGIWDGPCDEIPYFPVFACSSNCFGNDYQGCLYYVSNIEIFPPNRCVVIYRVYAEMCSL